MSSFTFFIETKQKKNHFYNFALGSLVYFDQLSAFTNIASPFKVIKRNFIHFDKAKPILKV